MPEIIVYAAAGRSAEQKKALMSGITEAVEKALQVPKESVVVSIVETPKADKMKGGVLFSER
ncbi:tautomerase family protein [Robbsia sp. KACC 23696]|uniref:tautomerase family protein n=1 Tax=Robbsia sp. KACC 23696 TaxID=3149231 RepID=UPI00325AEB2A